jgi:hypothetical protein
MTGYKFMKRTRMCSERTDIAIRIGRSPLCDWSLIICYMFFLTLMHPLEVITSFRYSNIIWVKNCYIAIPSYLPRGEKWLYSHFSGGGGGGAEIYYIAISPPIQIRGKYGYIAIFRGKNGSKTPARIIIIRFADI